MAKLVFKRKIYDRMLQWKQLSAGKSALLVQGARRIGKSTIVEEFAKKEYHSYILIDFNKASADVKALFDDLMDLDFLFLQLQTIYNVSLKERKSLIIFDEVQMCPKARQAIKYLVADHRYDYIETGSLISIRQNTRGITIPSEEERIDMFPMDFEEFRWALGDTATMPLLRTFLEKRHPLGAAHRAKQRDLRLYMLVGGMPQAVGEYIQTNNLAAVDTVKRSIVQLYADDTGLFVTMAFWDSDFSENTIYQKLLADKLDANLGYVYENIVAQMLTAAGNKLFYYTFPKDDRHLYEVDFIIPHGSKICPIEVKSSGYKTHASLDAFRHKFSARIANSYILYTRDLQRGDNELLYLPVYMTPLL